MFNLFVRMVRPKSTKTINIPVAPATWAPIVGGFDGYIATPDLRCGAATTTVTGLSIP